MRLAAYLRVSTDAQTDGLGLDVQDAAIRHWANRHGHQIVAKFIAFVHRSPYLPGCRIQRESNRITQSSRILPRIFSIQIANRNRRANGWIVGFDIAVGADGNKQMFAIRGNDDRPRRVAASRHIQHVLRISCALGSLWIVVITHDLIGIADVHIIVME